MDKFLSQNAALLIAVLGVILTIIIQWDVIIKRFSNFAGTFDSVPFIIFKLLAVFFSGTFVASIFWIMIDFIVAGKLSLNIVLLDIASGAAWGIPLALFGGFLSRGSDGAMISGALVSIIILLLFGPEKIIAIQKANFLQRQIYSIVLILLVVNIGVACGYAGFKTRFYIDNISAKAPKSLH